MKQAILTAILFLTTLSNVIGAPLSADLVEALSGAIRKRCPDAKIGVSEQAFVASYGTMMFALHGRSKTGEIFPQTYEEEGPNFKGFILRIVLHDGKYQGAATVPQTLQGPYFRTFIDALATDDGKKYYEVRFSFGNGLDPQLKEAIFEALPKTTGSR